VLDAREMRNLTSELREDNRLTTIVKGTLCMKSVNNEEKVTGRQRKICNEELHEVHRLTDIIIGITRMKMAWMR
jgi:hypothetical protein